MAISEKYQHALQYCTTLHKDQVRKGSGIPYISHLLSVSCLIWENGGDEQTAIAGLLHDAAEDQGGEETLAEIEHLFGSQIASIVRECSDSLVATEEEKQEWRIRKKNYLQSLPGKSGAALLVTLADKYHNAASILQDYRRIGDQLWDRFHGKKDGTLWYYQQIIQMLANKCSKQYLFQQLKHTVAEIHSLANK